MIAGCIQGLSALPAAVMMMMKRPSVIRRQKRLTEDQLVTAGASRPDRLTVVTPAEQLLIGPEVDQVSQSLAAL